MTTMEKPQSNRAKSFNRFNGTHDHGTTANQRTTARERIDSKGSFFDKNYLNEKGTPAPGYPTIGEMTHDQLEAEADRLLRRDEEANRELEWLPLDSKSEVLKSMAIMFQDLYRQMLELQDALATASEDYEVELGLKGDIEQLKIQLEALEVRMQVLMGEDHDYEPTIGEYEGRTEKEIRDSLARAATLDTFSEDDFGDEYRGTKHSNSHIRISNRPR